MGRYRRARYRGGSVYVIASLADARVG